MKGNIFFKLLGSIPIILIALYFIPFLGICLILFRFYLYGNRKSSTTSIVILVCGLIILIPEALNYILKLLNLNVNIPYLNNIINSHIYLKLLSYSKLLIIIGVIFLILSFIFKNLLSKFNSGITNYIKKDLEQDYEIRKENDLKMQEKREKAKNTHVVHCPYCGSDNMLIEKVGTCKFCRRKIEYKE